MRLTIGLEALDVLVSSAARYLKATRVQVSESGLEHGKESIPSTTSHRTRLGNPLFIPFPLHTLHLAAQPRDTHPHAHASRFRARGPHTTPSRRRTTRPDPSQANEYARNAVLYSLWRSAMGVILAVCPAAAMFARWFSHSNLLIWAWRLGRFGDVRLCAGVHGLVGHQLGRKENDTRGKERNWWMILYRCRWKRRLGYIVYR